MELQTARGPLKSEMQYRPSPAHQHLLIYYWTKLLTVWCSSHADVSLETHCNKMNCHCFLAELYKLPHQSHNMGLPPLAINQWERRRCHKVPLHFPELRSASGWQVLLFSCCTWGARKWRPNTAVKARCFKAETSEFTDFSHNVLFKCNRLSFRFWVTASEDLQV